MFYSIHVAGYALSLNVESAHKHSWGGTSVWDDGCPGGLSSTASSLGTDGRERCLGSLERRSWLLKWDTDCSLWRPPGASVGTSGTSPWPQHSAPETAAQRTCPKEAEGIPHVVIVFRRGCKAMLMSGLAMLMSGLK